MLFNYRVVWIDVTKNRQRFEDFTDQQIALFVAKKKVSEGMQDVIIQVSADQSTMADQSDVSWPAIDAEASEVSDEIC